MLRDDNFLTRDYGCVAGLKDQVSQEILAKLVQCENAHPWDYDHEKGTVRHYDRCLTAAPNYDLDGGARLTLEPCSNDDPRPNQVFRFTRYKSREEGPLTIKDLVKPLKEQKQEL